MKLSDFGLVKDQASTFTRTQTEMRGSIREPQLHAFNNYGVINEIYCLGWVLAYIFTGKEVLLSDGEEVGRIFQKCTAPTTSARYQGVRDLIADVERLEPPPTRAIS